MSQAPQTKSSQTPQFPQTDLLITPYTHGYKTKPTKIDAAKMQNYFKSVNIGNKTEFRHMDEYEFAHNILETGTPHLVVNYFDSPNKRDEVKGLMSNIIEYDIDDIKHLSYERKKELEKKLFKNFYMVQRSFSSSDDYSDPRYHVYERIIPLENCSYELWAYAYKRRMEYWEQELGISFDHSQHLLKLVYASGKKVHINKKQKPTNLQPYVDEFLEEKKKMKTKKGKVGDKQVARKLANNRFNNHYQTIGVNYDAIVKALEELPHIDDYDTWFNLLQTFYSMMLEGLIDRNQAYELCEIIDDGNGGFHEEFSKIERYGYAERTMGSFIYDLHTFGIDTKGIFQLSEKHEMRIDKEWEIEGYLSNNEQVCGEIKDLLLNNPMKRILFIGDTGSGKTKFILDALDEFNEGLQSFKKAYGSIGSLSYSIMSIPRRNLINNLKENFSTDKSAVLTGSDEMIKGQRESVIATNDKFLTTPDHANVILEMKLIEGEKVSRSDYDSETLEVLKHHRIMILDECHMLANDSMFKSDTIERYLAEEEEHMKNGGVILHMTATPESLTVEGVYDLVIKVTQSLEKYYFIRSKPSLKYAYQQMVKEYFSKEDEKSGYKVLDLDKPIISYDQFYYWYRKWYKPEDAIHKREGRREFLQNYRAITGSATEDSMGIGTYAIDATIGDVYLVSSFDRNIVIGRPVIYLTVDIFSRCIVSVYAGIQNMSKESLRLALANAFEDKKEFCKRTLDMDIDENDWPIHYLPHTILADRGSELISNELTQITADLNIKIQNLGPYRPELKAVCEKYFDILQDHISPFLPGAVQKDFMKRGGKDYRKKAVLNLNEYVQILVRTVLYYNNHNYLSDYPLTQSMIAEKVPPIPIEIFKWGLRKGTGLLRTMPLDAIRSSVLPKASAKITPKGINFGGLYYTCAKALKERWFSKARIKGSWSMGVHYDPQDVSNIYIRIDRLNYEVCSLIEQYEMYRGVKMEEVVSLKTERKQQEAEYEESSLNGAIQLAQDIEEIVKMAKKEANNQILNGEVPKDIKNIRENREKEREIFKREKQTVVDQNNIGKQSNEVNHDTEPVKVLDIFRKKQKEVLYDGDN